MNVNALIKPKLLAQAAQLHYDTVMRWRREGRLPPYDIAIGIKLRGWHLDTIRTHNPVWAELVEHYLATHSPNTPTP